MTSDTTSERSHLPSRLWLLGALGAVAWFTTLALVLTWPMARDPGAQALGSEHADGMKHLWTLWYMRASVWEAGAFPGFTTLVNWPEGMLLYPIEPLHGLIAVLLPWVDVVVLSNLLVVANMVATGLAGAWLGKELTGSWLGGHVAGTLLVGSSTMAFFVHVGVGELYHLWWLPLGLTLLLKARRTLQWRWFLALGLALVAATLSCFYYGFFLGMAVAIVALLTLWAGRETPRLLLRYAVAAGLSIGLTLPAIRTFSASYETPEPVRVGLWSYVVDSHGQPITDPPSARLQPDQLVRPASQATDRQQAGYVGGRFVGWIPLGLALIGLVRFPRRGLPLLAVAVVGGVLATGSYLVVGGQPVSFGDGGAVAMPLLWLNRLLSYVAESLNFPVRFLAMTQAALAGMAALAAAPTGGPRGRIWPAAAGLLAVLAVFQTSQASATPWPWARFPMRQVGDIRDLAELERAAVVDLSMAWRSDPETRWNALTTQMSHGLPIQAVPVERVEYFAAEGQHYVRALDLVKALKPAFNANTPSPPQTVEKDLALLREAGFGWLLVSYRTGKEQIPAVVTERLTQACGPAVRTGPGVAVWRIPESTASQEQLEAWRAEHALDVTETRELSGGFGPQLR